MICFFVSVYSVGVRSARYHVLNDMPAGVTLPVYLKFLSAALLSMFAGSQFVHYWYKPLQVLISIHFYCHVISMICKRHLRNKR